MNKLKLKGIIFDMDGVLVDSEHLIAEAAIQLFKQYGKTIKIEDFKPFIGVGEQKFLEGMAKIHKIELPDNAKSLLYNIYKETIKDKLEPVKGALNFIEACRTKGFKIAVATSADMDKLEANFNAVGFDKKLFDALITGENVKNKKPAPDIFIYAAKQLSLNPKECLVLEDAINGIKAAHSAGCKCIGIKGTFTEDELQIADWVATDLDSVPSEALMW